MLYTVGVDGVSMERSKAYKSGISVVVVEIVGSVVDVDVDVDAIDVVDVVVVVVRCVCCCYRH